MLRTVGLQLDDPYRQVGARRHSRKIAPVTGDPMTSSRAEKTGRHGGQKQVFRSLIGTGYYDTITPNVILRNVLQNPAGTRPIRPISPNQPGPAEASIISSR